jgi:hypothetical protein
VGGLGEAVLAYRISGCCAVGGREPPPAAPPPLYMTVADVVVDERELCLVACDDTVTMPGVLTWKKLSFKTLRPSGCGSGRGLSEEGPVQAARSADRVAILGSTIQTS